MSDDAIFLVPYDEKWPKLAAQEMAAIRATLPNIDFKLEHIGSTAIPGLSSKPIIDLLIGVDSLSDAEKFVEPLENMGYSYWRDNPKSWHFYFVKGLPLAGGVGRTHHVHIYEKSHTEFREKLLFCNYLKTHPETVKEYSELKNHLSSKYANDREKYTDAKTEFIRTTLASAESVMLNESKELVHAERLKYFEANGIPLDGGINDTWARYKIGPLTLIGFPNFQHRMEAILRHDLHHITLNLDTSSLGEGLIAAWELGSGCGRYWISWCMEPQALWWGILMAPRKTFSLFVIGRQSLNFFHESLPENFLDLTVGDLRKHLLPRNQETLRASFVDVLLFIFMAVLGILMILIFTPIFLFFTIFGGLYEFLFKRKVVN